MGYHYYKFLILLQRIGYGAFESCYGNTSITIHNSVTSIGDSVFQNCSTLTSITFATNNSN